MSRAVCTVGNSTEAPGVPAHAEVFTTLAHAMEAYGRHPPSQWLVFWEVLPAADEDELTIARLTRRPYAAPSPQLQPLLRSPLSDADCGEIDVKSSDTLAGHRRCRVQHAAMQQVHGSCV